MFKKVAFGPIFIIVPIAAHSSSLLALKRYLPGISIELNTRRCGCQFFLKQIIDFIMDIS
jgi:hypothetical protein